MSIKVNFENLIKNLERERDDEVAVIKDKATKEIIVPFNQEIDVARDKAIAEKQQELSANIMVLQEKFAKERQQIIDAAEKKKSDNASSVLATETYTVTGKYDKEITYLKERIAELKE